jgi:hypothetical protein
MLGYIRKCYETREGGSALAIRPFHPTMTCHCANTLTMSLELLCFTDLESQFFVPVYEDDRR